MLCNVRIRSHPLNEQQDEITLLDEGKLWFSSLNGEGLEPIVLPWKCHRGHIMELCDECNNCACSFSSVQKTLWERLNFLWFYTTLCPQNDVTCEIVLHTALPSGLWTSRSWSNANSVFYPTLSEWGQITHRSTLYEMSCAEEFEICDDLSNIIHFLLT